MDVRCKMLQICQRCANDQFPRLGGSRSSANFGVDIKELVRELPHVNESLLSDCASIIRNQQPRCQTRNSQRGRDRSVRITFKPMRGSSDQ